MRPAGLLTCGSTLTPAFPAGPRAVASGMLEDRSPLTVAGAVEASGRVVRIDIRQPAPYPIPVSLRKPWPPEHRSHAQQAPNIT